MYFEKRLLPAPEDERDIQDRTEFSGLYPALENTPQAPEAGDVLPRSRTQRNSHAGPTWPAQENRACSYPHFGYIRLFYLPDEMHSASEYHRKHSGGRDRGVLSLSVKFFSVPRSQ